MITIHQSTHLHILQFFVIVFFFFLIFSYLSNDFFSFLCDNVSLFNRHFQFIQCSFQSSENHLWSFFFFSYKLSILKLFDITLHCLPILSWFLCQVFISSEEVFNIFCLLSWMKFKINTLIQFSLFIQFHWWWLFSIHKKM